MIITCAACEKIIVDRFIVKVLERSWHSICVKCFDCQQILTDKCFTRDNKLFCKKDFFRRYGTKCAGCFQGISPYDMVCKARDKVFHINCFTCNICQRQLCTGEKLHVMDNNTKFICNEDYIIQEAKQEALFTNDEEDEDENDDEDEMDEVRTPITSEKDNEGSIYDEDESAENTKSSDESSSVVAVGSKRRGPRTAIKAKQLEILKTAFSQTLKPTRHIREQLAKETGLTMRVIQVWFQNKRSKERRLSSIGRRSNNNPFFSTSSRRIKGFPINFSPTMVQNDHPPFPYHFADTNLPEFYPDTKFPDLAYVPRPPSPRTPQQGYCDYFQRQPNILPEHIPPGNQGNEGPIW